jgi:dipeptidyl aminopeptidase/acylaminoacyl peptidase
MAAGACAEPERASLYSAPPDAGYAAQDITVEAPDGRRLAGTLTLPDRGRPAGAIVMVTGSGLQDRDEHIRGVGPAYRPFRQIADTLTRRGIATLRLDDPGVGGSDPFPPGATPFTYGDDITAALAFLRKHPGIDPSRLGVLGHSEGSVVAPYVAASDSLLRAVVLLAAPAYTLVRINAFQRGKRLELGGMTPEQVASEVERTARGAALEAARDPWRSAVWDYDPLPTARAIRAPILLVHGEDDIQVTPDQSDTLAAAFREGGNTDVTVHILPGTTHFLLRVPSEGGQGRPSDQVAPAVLGLIADWLVERLSVQPAG